MSRRKMVLGAPMEASMGYVTIEIESKPNSPMLQHRLDAKVLEGAAAEKKAAISPEKQSINTLHIIGPRPKSWAEIKKRGSKVRFGVPAWSFKHAIVDAAKFTKFHMKDIRRVVFVEEDVPEMVEIFGKPIHNTQAGKNQKGQAILVHRGMFPKWKATLRISFYARVITAQQVVELVAMAGFGGVGDKRPNGKNSSGTCGQWRVVRAEADVPDFDQEEGNKDAA